MPPGYSLNWGGNGDYDGGASRLTLTDLRGVTFIQDCFDGEREGEEDAARLYMSSVCLIEAGVR